MNSARTPLARPPRPPPDVPQPSTPLVIIGAAMVAWLALSTPKKRARIVWIIDHLLGEHGFESNVIVLRGVAQELDTRAAFRGGRAWWAFWRAVILAKAEELGGE